MLARWTQDCGRLPSHVREINNLLSLSLRKPLNPDRPKIYFAADDLIRPLYIFCCRVKISRKTIWAVELVTRRDRTVHVIQILFGICFLYNWKNLTLAKPDETLALPFLPVKKKIKRSKFLLFYFPLNWTNNFGNFRLFDLGIRFAVRFTETLILILGLWRL